MGESTKRLFFGIALTREAQTHIRQWLDTSVIAKKPSSKDSNWHLTLAFLPDVAASQELLLVEFARSLTVSKFSLTICEIGYWEHNGIFYLKPDNIPPSLNQLAAPLRNKGSELGIYNNPYGFAPHITLFRSHKPSPTINAPIEPFVLPVEQFHLYHSYRTSENGLIYQPIETFDLTK
jgi:2'-5' RNA ligase